MLDYFTAQFIETTKEELIPILRKPFQETEEEGTLTSSFFVASINPIPKPNKNITVKENYGPVSLINIDVNVHLKLSKFIRAKTVKLL